MKAYTVYRVDYAKRERTAIGTVVERRMKPRPDSLYGLLLLARKMFSSTPQEAFQVVLSSKVLTGF